MKMMHGACFLAWSNMSRTREAAHADEHLDEVGTGNGEERHLGFAGDGLGQQGLAGAGRADHQHAARDTAAQALELARIAKELDQLADLLLGLVAAGDVSEGGLDLVLGQQARLALAEAHRAARDRRRHPASGA